MVATHRIRTTFWSACALALFAPGALAGLTINDVVNSNSGVGAPFDSFGPVAVNASHTLAFVASNDGLSSATGSKLLKLAGGVTLSELASSPSSTTSNINEFRTFELIDINDAGSVALKALYGGSTTSLRPRGILGFAPDGTPTVLVRDANGTNPPDGPLSATLGGPSINAAGNVLHAVAFDNTALGRELRTIPVTGGAATTLGDTLSTTTIEGTTFSGFTTGQHIYRDNGDVIGYFNYDRSGGQTSTLAQDSIYYYTAATGQFRTLLDDTDDVGHNGPYKQYTTVANVNASGRFATNADNFDTGEEWIVAYDLATDTFFNYADDTGLYDTFVSRPRVTDAGRVVFQATLDGSTAAGIYFGASPLDSKLVAVGDALFGGTLLSIELEDVNPLDETAYFTYALDLTGDGLADQTGVASAVIPEPATAALLALLALPGRRARRSV
jgi:hypothetical protein